ncbi:ExbD/TolR family protein [Sungkyunkwania multivorans]|uniref:ExbD/TolR family protein n=1 Tax=Sungkyunkwania multivorans TaxID=1173618 RepID=A0ABW3CWT4_9FLAO
MRNSRRESPAVHAGSMADIAFLLLIFFLVTTTIENDKGIPRKLPRPCLTMDCVEKAKERDVFRIEIDANNALLVENKLLRLSELRAAATAFLDNDLDGTCSYCEGERSPTASGHPSKAIISVRNDREISYDFYIAVQNELVGAYFDLRKRYAKTIFKKELSELNAEELKEARQAYPMLISEAEVE